MHFAARSFLPCFRSGFVLPRGFWRVETIRVPFKFWVGFDLDSEKSLDFRRRVGC